jgi:hypothetical protein
MIRFAIGCVFIIIAVPAALIAAVWFSMSAADKDALGYYAMMGGYVAVGLAVVAVGMFGNWRHAKREAAKLKMTDGAYDLWVERKHRWRGDLPWIQAVYSLWVGEKIIIDLNRTVSPAVALDAFGNFRELEPAGGWAMQHAYNVTVEATNVARAIAQGDDSRNNWFGRDSAPARIPARTLATRQPAQITGPVDNEIVEGEYKPLPTTLESALAEHKGNTILLGQDNQGNRALWNPQADPHLGIWGKSGQGKTTRLGLTAALGQARQGWRVLVIDPEQEGDEPSGLWGTLAPWVQVVGPGEPGCNLWEKVIEWYEQRWRNVQEAGATDAYHMPNGKPLRPMAIHFDELSRWRESGTRRGGKWKEYVAETDNALAEISQRGRKRGVHLALYGQLPDELPAGIAGNLVNLTFKQAENQGNKVGYWHAHNLNEGQFALGGRVYESFSPLLEAPSIMAGRSVPKFLLPGGVGVRSVGEGVYTGGDTGGRSVPNDGRTVHYDSTNLQKAVWDWRSVNPNGTQAQMRADFENWGIQIARGYAHECWHKWVNGTTNGASHD